MNNWEEGKRDGGALPLATAVTATSAPVGGGSKMSGWCINMEYKVLMEYIASNGFSVFGIFDGNSSQASVYMVKNMWGKLTSKPKWTLSYHVHDPNFLASLIVLACCDMVKCLRGDTGGSTSPAD